MILTGRVNKSLVTLIQQVRPAEAPFCYRRLALSACHSMTRGIQGGRVSLKLHYGRLHSPSFGTWHIRVGTIAVAPQGRGAYACTASNERGLP